MEFMEFEIDARRLGPSQLEVTVEDSPPGSHHKPCIVSFWMFE